MEPYSITALTAYHSSMTIFMKREEYMIIVMQTYHCIKKREVLEYNTPKETKKKENRGYCLRASYSLKKPQQYFLEKFKTTFIEP